MECPACQGTRLVAEPMPEDGAPPDHWEWTCLACWHAWETPDGPPEEEHAVKSKVIELSLNELIEADGETVLDAMEELWMADYDEEHRGILSNICYEAVGFNAESGLIQIRVTAEEEFPFSDKEE